MPKKSSRIGTEATKVKLSVRQLVLHESGYKCSNPACRHPLTLDVHHLYYSSEGGSDSADNLLPLCGNCHDEHHVGKIPTESLRAWKMLLLAMNAAFDRRSIDILLVLAQSNFIDWVTGDGVPNYAALAASNFITIAQPPHQTFRAGGGGNQMQLLDRISLSEKGRLFVEHWKKGDQRAAIELIPLPATIAETRGEPDAT